MSRARGTPYATLLRNFLTIFAEDEDRRRWQVEPLPLRFWRWRGSNLNKLKRLLHSFVSEIIVECAIKCAHHVINPNDLLDLLSCPPKTHLVQEPCFFQEKNTTNAAGKGSLFIVFHYYLSMGNHFKLEEWKQLNIVVLLLLSLRKWKRGRDLYLTRGDHCPSEKSSFFVRKLLRFTILLQGETSMPFVKMTWRMCTFFFNRKHIHEKHHTSLRLGLLCSPLKVCKLSENVQHSRAAKKKYFLLLTKNDGHEFSKTPDPSHFHNLCECLVFTSSVWKELSSKNRAYIFPKANQASPSGTTCFSS